MLPYLDISLFLTFTNSLPPFFVAFLCVWLSNANSSKRISILLVDSYECPSCSDAVVSLIQISWDGRFITLTQAASAVKIQSNANT